MLVTWCLVSMYTLILKFNPPLSDSESTSELFLKKKTNMGRKTNYKFKLYIFFNFVSIFLSSKKVDKCLVRSDCKHQKYQTESTNLIQTFSRKNGNQRPNERWYF